MFRGGGEHPLTAVWLAAFLVPLGGCAAGPPDVEEAAPSAAAARPVFEAGQVVTVRGVVVENVRACEVDGPCYLVLRAPQAEYTVLYAEARGRDCPNRAAIRAGLELTAGDEVEVYAQVTGATRLTTCPSADLSIHTIADGNNERDNP